MALFQGKITYISSVAMYPALRKKPWKPCEPVFRKAKTTEKGITSNEVTPKS